MADLTIDEVLEEISERGWYVVNMFQIGDGTWRVNLHSKDGALCGDFGIAQSPLLALQLALDNAENHATEMEQEQPTIGYAGDKIDLHILLGRKPIEKMRRI